MSVGKRIKEMREKLGISQVDFADKLNVSKQTLYKYENDIVTNIPSDKVELAAKLLNVSPAYLMGWEDEKNVYSVNVEAAQILTKEERLFLNYYRKSSPESRRLAAYALGINKLVGDNNESN